VKYFDVPNQHPTGTSSVSRLKILLFAESGLHAAASFNVSYNKLTTQSRLINLGGVWSTRHLNGEVYIMEQGTKPGMGNEMPMMEIWESLTDEQKKTLMKRMLDGKIMMKEGMIKHFQFKIETLELVKKMLDES